MKPVEEQKKHTETEMTLKTSAWVIRDQFSNPMMDFVYKCTRNSHFEFSFLLDTAHCYMAPITFSNMLRSVDCGSPCLALCSQKGGLEWGEGGGETGPAGKKARNKAGRGLRRQQQNTGQESAPGLKRDSFLHLTGLCSRLLVEWLQRRSALWKSCGVQPRRAG